MIDNDDDIEEADQYSSHIHTDLHRRKSSKGNSTAISIHKECLRSSNNNNELFLVDSRTLVVSNMLSDNSTPLGNSTLAPNSRHLPQPASILDKLLR